MTPGVGGYRQINEALNICAFEDYLESQNARSPKLDDVEVISPRVIRVLGQNPGKVGPETPATSRYACSLKWTNTYIIGTGHRRLIMDTGQGVPDWATLMASTLANTGIQLSQVLLTHWHGDHTGGVPDLIRMYPHLSSSIYKHSPSKAQQSILDGQIFSVEGATVRAVHSPGHSHDHMCFILEEENAMFTGDNVLGHGTAVVEHLSTWMTTLRNMDSHNFAKGYPAHGAVIDDLPAKISSELALKLRRERQVLQTLRQKKGEERAAGCRGNGSATVEQLVLAMYESDVGEGVRKLELEPFMDEVLRKLAEDGSVAFEMRGGVKKWFAIDVD